MRLSGGPRPIDARFQLTLRSGPCDRAIRPQGRMIRRNGGHANERGGAMPPPFLSMDGDGQAQATAVLRRSIRGRMAPDTQSDRVLQRLAFSFDMQRGADSGWM